MLLSFLREYNDGRLNPNVQDETNDCLYVQEERYFLVLEHFSSFIMGNRAGSNPAPLVFQLLNPTGLFDRLDNGAASLWRCYLHTWRVPRGSGYSGPVARPGLVNFIEKA